MSLIHRHFLTARITAAALGVLVACAMTASAEEKGTKYGDGVTLEQSVTVAELLARPADYLGKAVRVDGVVTAVCQNMGCWIQIADSEQSPGIQFKVDDGVIVFPKEGKGRRASAQGVFEALPAAEEHAEAPAQSAAADEHAKHMAEAAKASGPTYRVKATGAIVY